MVSFTILSQGVKFIKKLLSILLILTIALTAILGTKAEAAVKISKAKAILEVDATLQLKMTGSESAVKWSSSEKSIATVNSKGVVTAKTEGIATITASVSGKKYTCKVAVVDSNQTTSKDKFDTKAVLKEIQVVDEYEWNSYGYPYIAIVLKNNSNYTITNNGTVAAEFVEYIILYFKDGRVIDYGWGYCVDNDSEIKPGNTEYHEEYFFDTDFDSYKVYLTGRGEK